MAKTNTHIAVAAIYFILSVVLTGLFIAQKFWLYSSLNAMILSGSIAGAKWLLQIVAALAFLKEEKWMFIKRIGFVCFLGSVVLFVYYLFGILPIPLDGYSQFILSIALSVFVMIGMYYQAVKKTALPIRWFLIWLACLAVAITLQLTVVF